MHGAMLIDPRTDPPLSLEPGKPVGNIYYGACSWTDRTLIESGTFYPSAAKTAADRLSFYADAFPIVEVDATYYALPAERNAHLWVDSNPSGLHLQHQGLCPLYPPSRAGRAAARSGEGAAARYLGREEAHLSPRRPGGGGCFELGDAGTSAGSTGRGRQARLHALPVPALVHCETGQHQLSTASSRAGSRPTAVEFRGGGWMTDNYRARTLALLEKLGISYVVVDEPQGFRSSTPPVSAATSPLAVVPFHGHNAETYKKPNITAAERFRYLYSEDELKSWVAPIRGLAERADQVHVLMNNCYADYGVRNARQLAELLAR